ncbi:MAG: carbohydrate kinase family protein [Candidatus Spechtbacterales bacterium]|nr:carbohydrate kinase family protein [Candidatus Spechtbacterales bacterium]
MNNYDVIAIGSSTRDVYLESSALESVESDQFTTGRGICVPEGSKVSVDEIHYATGGSAVNASITFANQELETSILCKVGDDSRGLSVQKRLLEAGVNTENMLIDEDVYTAYSVVVHSPSGERSIFVYRGASNSMNKEEFPFDILQSTKWIFVTHLGGDSAAVFRPLLERANKEGVKVALNPGSTQLKMGKKLGELLKYVDILFVNREEAALLNEMDYDNKDEIFNELDKMVKGIAVMTLGPDGVMVSDGEYRWEAPALEEKKFIDRTGAGDAFGSGFTSSIIRGGSVEDAIQLGSANATGVVSEWGANNGVLARGESSKKFGKLKIKKTKINE